MPRSGSTQDARSPFGGPLHKAAPEGPNEHPQEFARPEGLSSSFAVSDRGACPFPDFLLFYQLGLAAPLAAQEAGTTPPPPKVQQLIELLDDPEVRQWITTKQTASPRAAAPPTGIASRWFAHIGRHLDGLRAATPRMVPEWVEARDRVLAEMNQGTVPILRNSASSYLSVTAPKSCCAFSCGRAQAGAPLGPDMV